MFESVQHVCKVCAIYFYSPTIKKIPIDTHIKDDPPVFELNLHYI